MGARLRADVMAFIDRCLLDADPPASSSPAATPSRAAATTARGGALPESQGRAGWVPIGIGTICVLGLLAGAVALARKRSSSHPRR